MNVIGMKRKIDVVDLTDDIVPIKNLSEHLKEKLSVNWSDTLTLFAKRITGLPTITNRQEYFRLLLEELLRYLFLLAINPTIVTLCPSESVDKALQCLFLNPVLYFRISDEILCLRNIPSTQHPVRVLPYNPLLSRQGNEERLAMTYRSYEDSFGKPPQQFWPPLRPVCVSVKYLSQHLTTINMDTAVENSDSLKRKIASFLNLHISRSAPKVSLEQIHLFYQDEDEHNNHRNITLMVSDPSRPRVFVESLRSEVIAGDVDMNASTVGDVKRGIQGALGHHVSTQLLYFNRILLRDDSIVLSSFSHKSEFRLTLCVCPAVDAMQLFVKMLDREEPITLRVGATQTVEEVKYCLRAVTGVSMSEQRLMFGGSPLNDGKTTLPSYNIKSGGTVHLLVVGSNKG